MNNILPQFEANQVLSNAHLNQIVAYLEEQGRLTRNYLQGYGVVSGLELRRESNTSVSIMEGVALSSAGYLVLPNTQNALLDAKGKRVIAYNKRKKFTPQNLLFPYKTGNDVTASVYDLFEGAGDVFQLVPSSEPDNVDAAIELLKAEDLNQHVVLLFVNIQVKELKSCEADSCMELGKQWAYSIIPLLLTKAGADKLLQNEYQFNPAPAVNAELDPWINAKYYLPDIPLARPDMSNVPENVTDVQLADIYKNALRALLTELADVRYTRIDESLKLIIKESFSAKPLSEFIAKINTLINVTGMVSRQSYFQYVYGFAKDFIEAYEELQDAVFEYASFDIPAINSFPHHVRLGMVPALNGVVSSNNYPPNTYRHGFTHSRNEEEQQKAYHELTVLYNRLTMLSKNFFATNLKVNDIRVTPSVESGKSFSHRAIPFYYDPATAIQFSWNPGWTRMAKTARVLSYYENANTELRNEFLGGKNVGNDENLFLPLMFRHDDKNFYRVEGHIGAMYTDVFKSLSQYITNYNLPFDLQLVRLNKNTVMLIRDKHIIFNDLESLYNVLREEIRSLLATELNYFSNIRLTKRVVRQVAERATAQAVEAAPQRKAAKLVEEEAVFYRSTGTKQAQQVDLGVTDSIYSLVEKFGGKVEVAEIANLLSGAAGISVAGTKATPAASFVSRMITDITNLQKTLTPPFENFNIGNFNSALKTLETDTKSFITFAKNQSEALLRDESNITKGELLDYLDRIFYECDFDKIPALDAERIRREEKVGINTFLRQYIDQNPGLEHRAGVWNNGTLVVVFNENGVVVGDFCLPYRSAGSGSATQFVLGVLKTILLSGQVLDINNVPVKNALVTLNDEKLLLDEASNFRKPVAPNSFLLLKASAEGFVSKEITINAADEDLFQNIILFTAAQEKTVNLIITVLDSSAKPVANAIVKIDGKQITGDANGVFKEKLKAGATAVVTVDAVGFKSVTQPIVTGSVDIPLTIQLTKIIKLSGAVIDASQKPVLNAKVSINGALIPMKENKFETTLESKLVYNLQVDADNLEKYQETINAGDVDIVNKNIVLQPIATFTVRTGIFIDWNALDSFRAELGRISRTGINNPRVTIGTRADTNIRNPQSPTAFLTNADVNSLIDNKGQTFNPDLKIFSSDEQKGGHTMSIEMKVVATKFSVKFAVEDKDIMVLVPARKNYASQGNFSATVRTDTGADNLKKLNATFASLFSMPNVNLFRRTIEFRFFTESDLKVFVSVLQEAGIVAQLTATR